MAIFRRRQLRDAYRFPGFVPENTVRGFFGDPKARVVVLRRCRKKQFAVCVAMRRAVITTSGYAVCEICRVETPACIWSWRCGEWIVYSAEA